MIFLAIFEIESFIHDRIVLAIDVNDALLHVNIAIDTNKVFFNMILSF